MLQNRAPNQMARSHNFTKRSSRDAAKQDEIETSGRTGFTTEGKLNHDALNAYLQLESPYKSPEQDQPGYEVL